MYSQVLTTVVWQSWHHDSSPDPVLERQVSGHGRSLQVLGVTLGELCEPTIREGGMLASQGR